MLSKKDIQNKLQKVKPETRNTLGWVHNREEACLGIFRGNLQYGKLKFNVYSRISCHIQDKDFDKTLSLLQDFKRRDFFKQQNRPYSISDAISYALSNTHHSECFTIIDVIHFPFLFNDVCQVQVPTLSKIEEIDTRPLSLHLQENPLLLENQMVPNVLLPARVFLVVQIENYLSLIDMITL